MYRTLEERVGAGYGAMGGLLLLWCVMTMIVDSGWCGSRLCRVGWHVTGDQAVMLSWQPFVQNPFDGNGQPIADRGPYCPARRPPASMALIEAPLPFGFDPRAGEAQGLFACVLVGRDGRVRAAYLLSSGLGRSRAGALLRSIREDWRFRPMPGGDAGWQRVRLFDTALAPASPSHEVVEPLRL